jgi:hypothetical protein
MKRKNIKSNYKISVILKYITKIKRKLCTVCLNGVHYEYVGDHNGEAYSYAEYCPCSNESIKKLICERTNRIIRRRSQQSWH